MICPSSINRHCRYRGQFQNLIALVFQRHQHNFCRFFSCRTKRKYKCRKSCLFFFSLCSLPVSPHMYAAFFRILSQLLRRISKNCPNSVLLHNTPEVSGAHTAVKILHTHRLQQEMVLRNLAVSMSVGGNTAHDFFIYQRHIEIADIPCIL